MAGHSTPCDYDLLAKMKKPLRGLRYNTREAIIRAVGPSLLDINRSGRADGVRRLPQIWQKVLLMSSSDRPTALIIASLVL